MCKDWKDGGAPGASPFKAVIFDMDGVLVDTEVYYLDCRGQFLTESGVEVSHEELLELVGASVKQDRANMLKWFTRSGISIDADGIEMLEGAWWQGRDIDYATLLNPGVKETLIELKRRGVRLALASSSSHRNIAQVLADCGLGGFFRGNHQWRAVPREQTEPRDLPAHAGEPGLVRGRLLLRGGFDSRHRGRQGRRPHGHRQTRGALRLHPRCR